MNLQIRLVSHSSFLLLCHPLSCPFHPLSRPFRRLGPAMMTRPSCDLNPPSHSALPPPYLQSIIGHALSSLRTKVDFVENDTLVAPTLPIWSEIYPLVVFRPAVAMLVRSEFDVSFQAANSLFKRGLDLALSDCALLWYYSVFWPLYATCLTEDSQDGHSPLLCLGFCPLKVRLLAILNYGFEAAVSLLQRGMDLALSDCALFWYCSVFCLTEESQDGHAPLLCLGFCPLNVWLLAFLIYRFETLHYRSQLHGLLALLLRMQHAENALFWIDHILICTVYFDYAYQFCNPYFFEYFCPLCASHYFTVSNAACSLFPLL